MVKFYPTRNDLDTPDKLERIVKDLYDRVYKPSKTVASKPDVKRVNVNTGKAITKK